MIVPVIIMIIMIIIIIIIGVALRMIILSLLFFICKMLRNLFNLNQALRMTSRRYVDCCHEVSRHKSTNRVVSVIRL